MGSIKSCEELLSTDVRVTAPSEGGAVSISANNVANCEASPKSVAQFESMAVVGCEEMKKAK